MEKNRKNINYEFIRCISIVAVVMIHLSYMGILQFGNNVSKRLTVCMYQASMDLLWWAVPCFLMLTGALLLNPRRKIDLKKLYQKYIFRMIVVLGIFALGFSWIECVFETRQILSTSNIMNAIKNTIEGNSWAHMWYVYCLIGLYVALPLWKVFAEKSTDYELKYLLVVMVVFNSILNLTRICGISVGISDHISTIYPFWLLMGAVWNRGMLNLTRKNASILLVLSTALLIVFSVIKSVFRINLAVLFGYDSVLVIIQAVSIYSICMSIHWESINEAFKSAITELADKSFGIYITHMIFVNIIYKVLKFNPFSSNEALSIMILLLMGVGVILSSYLCSCILKILPGFKKII